MYYRIHYSLSNKAIGKYPQVSEGIYPIHVDDPHFIKNFDFEFIHGDVVVPGLKLHPKAKVTDLISAGVMGLSGRRVISTRLKELIQTKTSEGLQYFETYLISNNEKIGGYWILHPYRFNYNCVDFNKSVIWVEGPGKTKIRPLTVKTVQEFTMAMVQTKLPEGLFFEKVVIQENCPADLLCLKNTISGIDYYVSERFKNELQSMGCTGIEFVES